MLPEIISFRKTYEQRRRDYDHLFSNSDLCSTMHTLWSNDLELEFNSPVKWQALWQLSAESCTEFNALYPSTVLITVQEVIFNELSAIVLVEETEDDLQFPGLVHVPLFELFPTREQTTVSLPLVKNLADWLDRCRFFFLYLWYPWDNTDDVAIFSWAEKHLENRLKLQCDIRNGLVDRATVHYVQNLLTSSLQIVDAIEGEDDVQSPSEDQKLNTVRNLIEREVMKTELNLMEIPELRSTMSSYVKGKKQIETPTPKNVTIITQPATLPSTAILLDRVSSLIPSDFIVNLSTNVNATLEATPPNSQVFLSPGVHAVKELGGLAFGGCLRGIGAPEETKVTPIEQSPARFMFLTSFAPLHYQNLTMERGQGVLIWVRDGTVRLENCHLAAQPRNKSSLTRGAVVQPGCRLEMINCVVSGLGTGVIVKEGASLIMESCRIVACSEGIKVMDSVTASLRSSTVEDCSSAAIVLDTADHRDVTTGGVDILNLLGLTIEGCGFKNNKTDAFIDCLPREFIDEA